MVVAFFLRECHLSPSAQCPVPSAGMGADVGEASGHGPSEFSIVRDSIRRDREALFEGTRAVRARRTRTSAPSFLQLLKDRSTHHRRAETPLAPRLTLDSPRLIHRSSYRVSRRTSTMTARAATASCPSSSPRPILPRPPRLAIMPTRPSPSPRPKRRPRRRPRRRSSATRATSSPRSNAPRRRRWPGRRNDPRASSPRTSTAITAKTTKTKTRCQPFEPGRGPRAPPSAAAEVHPPESTRTQTRTPPTRTRPRTSPRR